MTTNKLDVNIDDFLVKMFWQHGVVLIILRLIVILNGVDSQGATCQRNWLRYNNHCYQHRNDETTWINAQSECRKRDGNLVKIETQEENSWLKLFSSSSVHPWIGANDRSREGDWKWVTDNSKVASSDWGSGEPNNKDGDEDCVNFYIANQWNDSPCTSKFPFICEKQGCPNIANCITTVCTSLSDITCAECQKILYKLYNSDKECARTCSWEDRWCWPGSCGSDNYARDCRCDSESFTTVFDDSQARCQLTKAPEVITCRMQVVDANSDALMSPVPPNVPTHCSNQKDFYGNIQVDRIITNSSFELSVNVSLVPKPEYVTNHAFGVTDVNIAIVIKPILGTENIVKNISLHSDPNSNNPKQLLSFDKVIGNNSPPRHLSNGERICLRFLSRGGGHLVSKNIITRKETEVAFLKTFTVKDLCYHYDNAHPVHCLEQHICTSGLLDIDSRILITPSFQVNVSGWEDPSPVSGNTEYASGIDTYMTNVYEVKQAEPGWLDVGRDPIVISPIKASQPIRIIIPEDRPNPALYAVVLEVKDVANNVKQARRFVMLDNSSMVFARDDKPFYSTTTTTNTAHKWQTNHGALCYSWTDRYYNDKFKDLNLLQPIKPDYHCHITGIYEQISGLLPVSGTENVHGITVFYFSFANDTKTIHTKEKVPNFTSQKICLSPTVNDGETYRFDVEAQDIMKHSYSEYLYTHIDSSRPKIFDIGLTKDGYKLLNVHNSSDLSKMVLEFNALDIHSGLYSADWSLGTSLGGSDIGNGSVGVSRLALNESCPEHSNCYCPSVGPCAHFNFTLRLNSLVNLNTHVGNHNRGYHFTITVTNEARLVMVEHMEVLTDDSPPATGVVREGPAGGLDIDYTSKESFVAHWDGYIDHESGVRLYRVGLTRSCLEQDTFSGTKVSGGVYKDNETAIIETTFKFARFTLPEEGQYFVSVVAYNNAMQPSYPVCSDGILLDKTPPAVVNVTMRSASVIEKVMCSNETAWYISNNLTRYRVNDDMCDEMCRNTSVNKFISILPEDSSHVSNHSIACKIVDKLGIIYLPIDLIHLHWNVIEAESQVHEVYVGIGSTKDSGSAPDLVDFHKSPHKYSYKKRHIGLSDGDEIYIFLKITNSAGLSSVSSIGPVLVDETPPICPPSLPVSIENGSLYTYWDEGTFYDNEQKEPMTTFLYRVGQEDVYVSAFQPMGVPGTANCVTKEKICLTIPLSDLHVYDADIKLTFNIQLHVFNNAGYHCTVDTDTFHLPSRIPPGHGVLYDVTHDLSVKNMQDIDVLISSKEFCVTWQGFEHNDDIAFEVGIGRIPGSDDTTSFHDIPEVDVYCENAKILSYYHRYFVTVRAFTSGGTAVATSDGFTIINSSDITASLRVYDGYGCSSVSRAFPVQQVGTSNIYAPSKTDLHVGHVYTLESNTSITVESNDVILRTYRTIDSLHYYQFIPLNSKPQFTIRSELDRIFGLSVLNCIPDVDSHFVFETVSLHWSIGILNRYISHYEVELLSLSHEPSAEQSSPPVIIAYTKVSGQSMTSTFDDTRLVNGRYSVILRPCVEYRCLDSVRTDGFVVIDQEYDSFYVSSSLHKTSHVCSDISLSVTDITCPIGPSDVTSGGVGLRWGLFRDNAARIQLTGWNSHILRNTNRTDVLLSKCLPIPLYPHAHLFTCVEVYCPLGSRGVKCVPLIVTEDPNMFRKFQIYEIDADADDVRNNKDSFYAANIGDKMSWLHEAELDFTAEPVRPGGVILGMGDQPITWFLVRDSNSLNQSCEENPNCVAIVQTFGGFSAFRGVNLENGIMYFICADISDITGNNRDEMPSFQTCGNGFFVDINPPSTGDVTITSERDYIIDQSSLVVHWDGFKDFLGYKTLGYPFTLASFTYCIGSEPLGQDLVAKTNVGLYQSIIIHNPALRPGEMYYATVTAFDHVGHSTSAVSKGVIFDSTPPVIEFVQVGTYLKPKAIVTAEISIHLIGCHDDESGISQTLLGIGSTEHVPDIIDYQGFTGEFASLSNLTALYDGHQYYAVILVTNGAGLSSVAASDAFVIDRSSPTDGVVRDGLLNFDINFQPNTTHGGCNWSGFSDPHSGIRYYSAGLSTMPLGDDVRPMSFTGTRTEFQWTYSCVPGTTYYCTVRACNGAGLCTSVSSNGFTTDYSPPTPGIVHVGFDGHHSRYWAHANSIQVQWFGFVDAESGIMNYEVCVRHTDNSNCDIVPFTNVFMSNMMTNPVNLPQKVPLTVEVKAYNTLNMSVKIVSDSFIVDPTPPILMTAPVLGAGNGENDPQVIVQSDPSLVTLTWKFKDDESPIIKHIVSVKTHHDGHTPVENVYLSTESSHIFTLEPRDWLRPGDSYTAIVTACNEAGLCTSATSNDLLVDPTPPHRGGFEEPLTWHMSSDSNETVSFINLTLHGFKDTESGIKIYYVTVGDSYSGSEISNGLITFPPSGLNGELETVQLILTEHLQSGRQLIFSVWVENNAGLFSDTGKVTVTVIASDSKITYGYLEILKHSCDAEYCNRDCTCAVITQKCHTIDVDTDCKEENKTDDYDLRIHVHHGGKNKQREALSATSACISANWTVTGTRGQGIKRTEWSMGQLDMPIGTGIFDPLLENLWYDIGQRTWVTHCLQGANHLLHDTSYVVYIRAWTSTSDFTVFTSAAVHIDTTHPSVRKGQYIRENLNESCDHDIDFTTTLDTLTACWSGVFSDPQSGIDMYFVALGTIPGGDDVISISKVGQNTSTSWVNLTLSPGTKYYVSVTCINHVGIHTTIVSDGVLVDNERPHAGVVFNTDSFRNGHAQNTRDVGASFWGFDDRHSAIESFYIALQISNGDFTTDNISLKFQHIGLRNTFTFYNTSLVTGQWYRFAVKARDAAGFESDLVYSPRALFDSTPPVHIDITTVSVTEKVASTNGTLYWMKELDDVTGPTVYRLYISSANITSSNLFEVSFENQKQLHSVIMETIGTYTVAISFTSSPFYKGNRSISVLAHDMPIYAEIDLTLLTSDDVTVTGQTNNVIDVQQVSTTELQINGNIIDAESGIRDIYVGLGSNRGGFQMYPLLHVSSSYNILLPVEAPHGQPVHVTITTVSQAGCWSHFHSRPVIMDHTAPIISNTLMTTTFSVDEVQTLTSVKVTWKVTDEQSSYIDCFCEIGTNMMSGILYRGKGKSECETPYTYIQHGTNVFTRIRCLNSANLQQSTLVGPKTVILSAPNVAKVRIAFDTAYDTAFGLPVIPSSSKLTFSWENFDDSYGIKSYSYRIYRGTQGLTEWEKTDLRNYASLDHTGKHDDGIYTVEVKACAYDGLFCQVVNGSVLISGISPSLTGLPAAVTRQDAGLELVWDDAFTIQPSLLPRYTVTVGSERGFVDLVRFVETTEQRHVIIDYFSGSDVFVVIKCSYVTGLFTTFSGKLPVF